MAEKNLEMEFCSNFFKVFYKSFSVFDKIALQNFEPFTITYFNNVFQFFEPIVWIRVWIGFLHFCLRLLILLTAIAGFSEIYLSCRSASIQFYFWCTYST